MPAVLVEFWGSVDRTNAYDWMPLGRIEAESLDIDYLKEEALKLIKKMEHRPQANIVRLEVLRDGKKDMKITLTDLW